MCVRRMGVIDLMEETYLYKRINNHQPEVVLKEKKVPTFVELSFLLNASKFQGNCLD